MTDAIRDGNHVTVALGISSADSTVTLPFTVDSATGRLLTNSASGSGDVVGPSSATNNAIARFDTTTGKLIQNSVVTIADTTGVIAGTEGVTFSGATSGTTAVAATAEAGSTTLTLPAATDTLIGKASTDTLTNKSIDQDGTGNSITNIANASIKASAAIAVNKLAALTASEIVISDASGFISSAAVATYPSLTELTYVKGLSSAVQTQLDAKGAGDALTSNGLDQFASTTSAELRGVISNETGTGVLVFGTSPTFTTSITVTDGSTIDADGIDLVTGNDFQINNVSVLNATTLGANIVTSSLTTVGALDSGSITSNFGSIDNGASSITTTGTVSAGQIALDATPDADHTATGPVTSTFAAGENITVMDLLYFKSDGEWWKSDADVVGTAGTVMLALSLETKTDGQVMKVALAGSFVRDDSWNWTVGATLYVDDATAGAITATKPTATDAVVRVVGFAVSADVIYFNPSSDHITLE